jgi:hypothetical protein
MVTKRKYLYICNRCRLTLDVDAEELKEIPARPRIPFTHRFGCLVGVLLVALFIGSLVLVTPH